MMYKELIIALLAGTVLMLGVMMVSRKWYEVPAWKVIIAAPMLTLFGFASVKLMYFVESGGWSGLSFFGAVLLIPLCAFPAAFILRMQPYQVHDLYAPSICVMLAVMKVQCVITGCCKGIVLCVNELGENIRFPSQIVELCNALLIMIILLMMMRKGKWKGKIYPWFMIIYGVLRFLLNLLRDTEPFVWILPAGNFWSLISIAIGIVWLVLAARNKAECPESLR